MELSQKVVTRFAPSPTGKAHAGSYRTAMYSWLYARNKGGKFILRIEDTDTARNDKESELDIYEALTWLGLNYDEKYIQSEHVARHKEILETLIASGNAYISREEAKDGSGVMKDIVRFKNPKKIVTFNDQIRGTISTDTTDLEDFVIARNINEPLYHLAVIVDDHDEGVTHVIRAEEHIANTPRQILLIEALGWELPSYAHIPIVLGPDKQKLSKRKGALAMTEYAKQGYLKDAVFNAIAMIGWNPADPGSPQEIFSVDELIERFDFGRVQKSPAIFNIEKLDWFNREYIKKLSHDAFIEHARPFIPPWADIDMLNKVETLLRERIAKFTDVGTFFEENEYLFKEPLVDQKMLVWKTDTIENAKMHLGKVKEILEKVDAWTIDGIKAVLMPYAEAQGKGNVLWPLRVALSGKEKSPDPFELATLLGKEATLKRITVVL
ncbi:MAG: glutamate--tRNA ligase [Candidatus Pacebacteria bacterium]|nr:glutamate--tRNA ligase [Candidatus Paceibacterota bacterium]